MNTLEAYNLVLKKIEELEIIWGIDVIFTKYNNSNEWYCVEFPHWLGIQQFKIKQSIHDLSLCGITFNVDYCEDFAENQINWELDDSFLYVEDFKNKKHIDKLIEDMDFMKSQHLRNYGIWDKEHGVFTKVQ